VSTLHPPPHVHQTIRVSCNRRFGRCLSLVLPFWSRFCNDGTDYFFHRLVRYIDEIQCAASRVVQGMRAYAMSRNSSNADGSFNTFHVRRNDFANQYQSSIITAEEVYDNVKGVLPDGSIVYVATDESDKSYFEPLKQHFDVKFLDDFMNELNPPGVPLVNTNFYGMIDQLVVSPSVVASSGSRLKMTHTCV
jgi:GDP-fucose protein O-fucosyltransferase